MTGKCWNVSPPRQAIALEFQPRERRNSTARIARRPAIPRTSRCNLGGAFIAEVWDAFYTMDASEASGSGIRGIPRKLENLLLDAVSRYSGVHDSRGHWLRRAPFS